VIFEKLLPIIFAIIAGATYYYANKFDLKRKIYYHKVMSLFAGISITYVLLELFPTFTEGSFLISKLLFLFVAFGFISHHIIEKYIYQHNKMKEMVKILSFEENVFTFVYHIILGIMMVTFIQKDIIQGVLFFIPLISYTFVSTLPTSPHVSNKKSILLASSTLFGVLLALFIWTSRPAWAEFALIGFSLGVLLFTVIRHHIPFGKKGRIWHFSIGFLIYTVLIVASWYF
jgi:hypothetical protein